MGGRGASSGAGKGIAKELLYYKDTASLDDYLASLGLSSPISGWPDDKLKGNRHIGTQRGNDRFNQEARKDIDDYHDRKANVINCYNKFVSEGKIKEPTPLQKSYR